MNKHSAPQGVSFDVTERKHKGEDECIQTGTPTLLLLHVHTNTKRGLLDELWVHAVNMCSLLEHVY